MQRLIRRALLVRCFSTYGRSLTPPPVVSQTLGQIVRRHHNDKDVIHSHIYQALLRVFEYQQKVTHRREDLHDLQKKLRASHRPVNVELMDEYFRLRLRFGFEEQILAEVLHLLSLQDERGMMWTEIGTDIYGYDLLNSPKFQYMIDDVLLLTDEKQEVNVDALRRIIQSLTRLQFRDFNLLAKIADKLEKMLDFDSSTLSEPNKKTLKYFVRPNLSNYVNLPQKEVLEKALASIINIRLDPGTALAALKAIKPLTPADLEDFEQAMNQLEVVLKGYAALNLDFMHTIYSIREYYLDLKSEERMAFMQKNPDLLLDFLRLEKKLLMCDFLMPKNLLEKESKEIEDIKLLVDRFLFQQRINPKVAHLLIRTANDIQMSDTPAPKPGKDIIQPNLVYSDLLGALEEMLNWCREKFPSAYPSHDFADAALPSAFGMNGNTFRASIEQVNTRGKIELTDKPLLVHQRNAAMPHHGYLKTFQHLCTVFDRWVDKFETNAGPKSVNLSEMELTPLLQLFCIARHTNRLPLADRIEKLIKKRKIREELTEETAAVLATNMELVSKELFNLVLYSKHGHDAALGYIQGVLEDPFVTLEAKFTALNLGVSVFRKPTLNESRLKFISLLEKSLDDKTLELLYMIKPGYSVPVPHDFVKYFFVLDFAKKNVQNFYNGQNKAIEKALARVGMILEADWEVRRQDEPAYSMLLPVMQGLSRKYSGASGDMLACVGVPPQLRPALTLHAGKKAIMLLKPDQFADSKFVHNVSKVLKNNLDFEMVDAVRVNDFFKDDNFQADLKFELRPDLDEFLTVNLTSPESNELVIQNSFNDAIDSIRQSLRDPSVPLITDYSVFVHKMRQVILKAKPASREEFSQRILAQFQLLAATFGKGLVQRKIDAPPKVLDKVTEDIKAAIKNNPSIEQPVSFPFRNRHFGLEPYAYDEASADPAFHFLNFKTFSNPDYFVIPSWKSVLEETVGPAQYHEGQGSFLTQFGRLNRVLLPNPSGRVFTAPPFQLFWEDMLRPATPEARHKAMKYQSYADQQQELEEMTEEDQMRLNLLNFIYEFRAKSHVGQTLAAFCSMDFWSELANKIVPFLSASSGSKEAPEDNKNFKSIFPMEDFAYFFDLAVPTRRRNSEFQISMKAKFQVRDRVLAIQKRLNKEIPEEYRLADSEIKREALYNEYRSMQHDYVRALEEYQETIDPHGDIARDSYIKDLVYRFEGSVAQLKLVEEQDPQQTSFFNKENEMVEFGVFFAMEFVGLYKKAAGLSLSPAEAKFLDLTKYETLQLTNRAYSLELPPILAQLPSLFSASDLGFLEQEFPSLSFQNFTGNNVINFLCAVSTLGELQHVHSVRNSEFLAGFIDSNPECLSGHRKQLLDDMSDTLRMLPRNSLRFFQNYLENAQWRQSLSVTPDDLATFKEMLSLLRRCLIRRRGSQQALASP